MAVSLVSPRRTREVVLRICVTGRRADGASGGAEELRGFDPGEVCDDEQLGDRERSLALESARDRCAAQAQRLGNCALTDLVAGECRSNLGGDRLVGCAHVVDTTHMCSPAQLPGTACHAKCPVLLHICGESSTVAAMTREKNDQVTRALSEYMTEHGVQRVDI